jgi:hypothetical protein
MVEHRQGTTFIGQTYVCSYADGTPMPISTATITAVASYDGVDKPFTVGNGITPPTANQFSLLVDALIDWEVGQWRVVITVVLADGFTFKIDDIIWVKL